MPNELEFLADGECEEKGEKNLSHQHVLNCKIKFKIYDCCLYEIMPLVGLERNVCGILLYDKMNTNPI